MRTTPSHINSLNENDIFVFGSNAYGMHAGGAAAKAMEFGAIWGQAEGLQGQTYAINTMSGLDVLQKGVDTFITFAKSHPHLTFLVTPIGCGIAGHSPKSVAPMFRKAIGIPNIVLPSIFLNIITQ